MKTLMATLVLFASLNAQASAGQWFREEVLNMAAKNGLVQVDVQLKKIVCGLDTQAGVGSAVLKSKSGELYLVVSDSFYSEVGSDVVDSAVLTEIEGCGKKTVRF